MRSGEKLYNFIETEGYNHNQGQYSFLGERAGSFANEVSCLDKMIEEYDLYCKLYNECAESGNFEKLKDCFKHYDSEYASDVIYSIQLDMQYVKEEFTKKYPDINYEEEFKGFFKNIDTFLKEDEEHSKLCDKEIEEAMYQEHLYKEQHKNDDSEEELFEIF